MYTYVYRESHLHCAYYFSRGRRDGHTYFCYFSLRAGEMATSILTSFQSDGEIETSILVILPPGNGEMDTSIVLSLLQEMVRSQPPSLSLRKKKHRG